MSDTKITKNTEAAKDKKRKKGKQDRKRIGLSGWILISIILGITAGFFFGDLAAKIAFIGDAYIKLIQMTVLPYILVSLVAGIGSLSAKDAGLMARKGGIWMLILWAIGFAVILGMALSFPDWISASFYTTSLVVPPESVNFLDLYIPSNPFYSLSAGLIPAIVLFSLALGIALMNLEGKEPVLKACHTLSRALVSVSGFIVRLSPIGLFAITAAAAGTLTTAEFNRLQVYFIAFIAAAFLLSLWLLPALATAFTPFSYRDIMKRFQAPFLVAFTTGNLFVVLPILIEGCKEMFREKLSEENHPDNYIDVLLPVYFNFPNLGKLLIILFIPFAFWFNGSDMPLSEYPNFIVTGLITFFGSLDLAIPFLLDFFRLPADLYNLYVVSGVITGRFATLVGAVNLVVFTLLTTAALTGLQKFSIPRTLVYAGSLILVMGMTVSGLSLFMNRAMENPYDKDVVIYSRDAYHETVSMVVRDERPEKPPRRRFEQSLLEEIRSRGTLRVGYRKNSLPWAYRNNIGELVGLDVEMANMLARDLGVGLELIPYTFEQLDEDIRQRRFDIALSTLYEKDYIGGHIAFTEPYMDVTASFVVPDYLRADFETITRINDLGTIRIGHTSEKRIADRVSVLLPHIEWVEMEDYASFFNREREDLSGVLITAEAGSTWTLLYPEFNVSVVKPKYVRIPVSMAAVGGDTEFLAFLNRWINVVSRNGEFDSVYAYWILGEEKTEDIVPRWSVLRNVLGWVE